MKKTSSSLLLLALVIACAAPAPVFPENGPENVFDVIKSRRSVRDYLPTPVPREHILKICDAARMAPTSGNQQPWKFLVVQDRAKLNLLVEEQVSSRIQAVGKDRKLTDEEREALREKGRKSALKYLSAPVLIVVLTDSQSQYPSYNHWDGPLAAGYLMLAARGLGYGTVFVTDAIDFGIARKVLEIPERYEIVCLTPLGVPAQWPETPAKKPLESFVVFESFGK